MRYAEVQAKINSLDKRAYPTKISTARLEFANEQGRPAIITVQFATGLGIVTGGNGAGKTTLLRSLSALNVDQQSTWPVRLASVTVSGTHADQDWVTSAASEDGEAVVVSNETGTPPRLIFIDPFHQSQEVQRQVIADPNALDLIEGSDPSSFSSEWLTHASRVLQRNYSAIEVVEFESVEGEEIAPWISVNCDGTRYDLRSMGRGEFSALYLLWRLSRIGRDSIVIIDEPEAGLAAYSQARLKETLATISVERGVQFIITTHAPDMYLGLNGKPVTVIETLPQPRSNAPVSGRDAAKVLQLPRASTVICAFAEDAVAASLLSAILRAKAPDLLEQLEIHYSRNGESALEKIDEEFIAGKSPGKVVRLLTVFDGDQRRMQAGRRNPGDDRAYLPGDLAPEAVMARCVKDVVLELEDVDLEVLVGDVFAFRGLLSRESGSDHHDWFVVMAELFSSYDATCDTLLKLCLKDDAFESDADELVERLRATL